MNNTHILEKIILLRKKGKTHAEICTMLNIEFSKLHEFLQSTEHEIQKNLELGSGKSLIQSASLRRSNEKQRLRFKLLRDEAYDLAKTEAENELNNKLLYDFVAVYLGEGDKKNRNNISIVNIDISTIILSYKAIRILSTKKIEVVIRYYPDQDYEKLKEFWISHFGLDNIKYTQFAKKKQTDKTGLRYFNTNGLITLRVNDTYAKSRLNAYIDYLKESWKKN